MKDEDILQCKVVAYLRAQYPDIIFCSSMAGVRLPSIGSAIKAKRMGNMKGVPDLLIFEPRGGIHGLMIELKSLHGELSNEQNIMINKLKDRDYWVKVCYDFCSAKEVIDRYMHG